VVLFVLVVGWVFVVVVVGVAVFVVRFVLGWVIMALVYVCGWGLVSWGLVSWVVICTYRVYTCLLGMYDGFSLGFVCIGVSVGMVVIV